MSDSIRIFTIIWFLSPDKDHSISDRPPIVLTHFKFLRNVDLSGYFGPRSRILGSVLDIFWRWSWTIPSILRNREKAVVTNKTTNYKNSPIVTKFRKVGLGFVIRDQFKLRILRFSEIGEGLGQLFGFWVIWGWLNHMVNKCFKF